MKDQGTVQPNYVFLINWYIGDYKFNVTGLSFWHGDCSIYAIQTDANPFTRWKVMVMKNFTAYIAATIHNAFASSEHTAAVMLVETDVYTYAT